MSILGCRELGPEALQLALLSFWRHRKGLAWPLFADCKMKVQNERMDATAVVWLVGIHSRNKHGTPPFPDIHYSLRSLSGLQCTCPSAISW